MAKSENEEVVKYWMKYYISDDLCGLCGNCGQVDTTASARSPLGKKVGIRTFCICPNGQVLRKHAGRVAL